MEDGGDGRFVWRAAVWGEMCLKGARDASSQYVQNFESFSCHSCHCSLDAKRLYLMLLKNSTSMTWISVTDMPETSAHVLFVYVLSSRTTICQSKFIHLISSKPTFIAQHQRNSQQPIFTSASSLHCWIDCLQSVNE